VSGWSDENDCEHLMKKMLADGGSLGVRGTY